VGSRSAGAERERGLMALNARQQRFVEEYLIDLNATQAAIRAGYSAKTAEQQGPRLLGNVGVGVAIQAAKARRTERVEVTQDWVLARLVENVERSMTAAPVRDREGNETGEYVYAGSVANKALELLGKHVGMFAENVNLRTPEGIDVRVTRRVIPATNRIAHLTNGTNGNGNGNGH